MGVDEYSEKENERTWSSPSTPELSVFLLMYLCVLEVVSPRCYLLHVSFAPLLLWIDPVSLVEIQP